MKIHTNQPDKVKEILSGLTRTDLFGETQIPYKLLDNKKYFIYHDLENEDYFDLPEFKWAEHLVNRHVFKVDIKTEEEKIKLCNLFGLKPTKNSYIIYDLENHPLKDYEYEYSERIQPRYPIYVITKGRWEKTYTINTLEDMGVDFYICVEPKEYEKYCSNTKIDRNKILVLPENFSERNQGAVPVRNFCWEHSVQNGFSKHWQLDDNILWFYRANQNVKKKVRDGVFFRMMEDFSDKFENIGLTSCQYVHFIPTTKCDRKQFVVNTRAYSCILINSELLDQRLDERWRGRSNDDTDLSLRVLSTGDLCTVNFNNLLSGKQTSGSMKGGMEKIYEGHSHEGYQKKFDELKNNWGDIVTFTNKKHKDGRPHHFIEYTKHFKQKLKLKEGVSREPKINDYNMSLILKKP